MAKSPLFTRKPMWMLYEEMKGENRLRRVLGPVAAHRPGRRRHHRHRHLRAHRRRRPRQDGPGAHVLLRGRGARLHLRGPVLRRVRLHGAGGRIGLHLRLRHAGRAVRLDHRLGPHPRIRRGLHDRRPRLVQELPGHPRRSSGVHVPEGARATRPSTTTRRWAASCSPGSLLRPAGDPDRHRRHHRARHRHPGERGLQHRHGRSSSWRSCSS